MDLGVVQNITRGFGDMRVWTCVVGSLVGGFSFNLNPIRCHRHQTKLDDLIALFLMAQCLQKPSNHFQFKIYVNGVCSK